MIRLSSALCAAGCLCALFPALLAAKSQPGPAPSLALPSSFTGQPPLAAPVPAEWWLQFSDPILTNLVHLAFAHNRDLSLGRARLLESRAGVRLSEQELFPRFSSSFGFTDSTRSNNSPAIPRIDTANPPPGFAGGLGDLIPRRYGLFESGFDASYEFDLFGLQRSNLQAARLDRDAQAESLRDTFVSLTAEIVRAYTNLREAQSRLQFSQQTIASLKTSVALLSHRIDAGLASEADHLSLQAQLAAASAAASPLSATVDQSLFALSALTGQPRDQLLVLAQQPQSLPPAPHQVAPGLPSELLLRRPDIRRATAQLQAATARRVSAEKEWFPRIRLTSTLGTQSGELTNLLSSGSLLANLGPRFTWGALQFRQTRATIDRQKAIEQQQLAALESTVLNALRDVDTALSQITRQREHLQHLEQSLTLEQRRVALAESRFTAGLTNYLPVLDAQRQAITTADQITQSRAALLRAFIALHKALGGGWPGATTNPPLPNPE